MTSSSKKQTVGYRYYMSVFMGLCRGPVDEIVQIDVGDIRAWPFPEKNLSRANNPLITLIQNALGGSSSKVDDTMTVAQGPNGQGRVITDTGAIRPVDADAIVTIPWSGNYTINAPDLFGGDKKEGGIAGNLSTFFGGPSQLVPDWLKTRLGGTVPDYRGVTTMIFDGLITSLNPYPKPWKVRVRRTERGWDGDVWQPDLVTIWMNQGSIKAMNGAHILYECFTNRGWARGLPRSIIHEASWVATAQTLFDEEFGLCLRYSRQSGLNSFIQEVLDHIGGSIYPDLATGNIALDLLRGDYDASTLPLFTYDTGLIALEDPEVLLQDDLVNETIVKWSDPNTGEDERQVRVQNLASLQTLGAPNSTTTSYSGIPTADLAMRLAQRDLKVHANALRRYKVVLDRRAWNIAPGKLFRISVPERNIFNVVLRAGKVNISSESGDITVEATVDVFGLPSTSFIADQPTEWIPPDRSVTVTENRVVGEAPYAIIASMLDPANLRILPDDAGMISVVAARPTDLSQGYDLIVWADGEDEDERQIGRGDYCPYVVSTSSIGPYQTVIPFSDARDIGNAQVGSVVQLGNEIGRLTDIDYGAQTISIVRGAADTLPQNHPAGRLIYIIGDNTGSDGREYVNGETVYAKIITRTSTGELEEDRAPTDSVVITGRQGRPYAPANMRVNGTPYRNNIPTINGDVELTWAHRNRVAQSDKLIPHQQGSTSREPGATYRVRVYDGDTTTVVRAVSDLTGEGFTYTVAMATEDGITNPWFDIVALRDGIRSHSIYRFGVTMNY